MRPPMAKWQKTSDAFHAIAKALEALAFNLPPDMVVTSADVQALEQRRGDALRSAYRAIAELREHIDTSEECEEP